jgi:hypothetical protein
MCIVMRGRKINMFYSIQQESQVCALANRNQNTFLFRIQFRIWIWIRIQHKMKYKSQKSQKIKNYMNNFNATFNIKRQDIVQNPVLPDLDPESKLFHSRYRNRSKSLWFHNTGALRLQSTVPSIAFF